MIEHTFTHILKTNDNVTKQEIINKVCKANNYNPDFGDTKAQYYERMWRKWIKEQFKKVADEEEEIVKKTNVANKLQDIDVSE